MTKLSKDEKSFRDFTYMSGYFPDMTKDECDLLWKWINAYTTVKVEMAKAPTKQGKTKCDLCGGRGEVDNPMFDEDVCCPKCNGEGKLSTKQGKKVKEIEKPPAYSATLDAWFGDVTEALNSLLKNK